MRAYHCLYFLQEIFHVHLAICLCLLDLWYQAFYIAGFLEYGMANPFERSIYFYIADVIQISGYDSI